MRYCFVLSAHLIAALVWTTHAVAADPAPPGDEVIAAAKAKAATDGKAVFVYSGVRCAWLQSPQIAARFEKYFVAVMLVPQEKSKTRPSHGGAATLLRRAGAKDGQPWLAFLDGSGNLIANSARPNRGNESIDIDFPTEIQQVEWFMSVLKETAPKMNEQDRKAIEDTLAIPILQRQIDKKFPPKPDPAHPGRLAGIL